MTKSMYHQLEYSSQLIYSLTQTLLHLLCSHKFTATYRRRSQSLEFVEPLPASNICTCFSPDSLVSREQVSQREQHK